MVREDLVSDVSRIIWDFREHHAPRFENANAALTTLLTNLREQRYEADPNMKYRKVVFLAHAVAGDVDRNLANLRSIVAKIHKSDFLVLPFVPYYADAVSLNDNDTHDRVRAIQNGHYILASGVVDELWLCGNYITPGMEAEKKLADRLGIPVIDKIGKL
jgi:hypothetical protein